MESPEIDPRFPRVGQGRRMLGLLIDWAFCYFITWGFFAEPGTGAFTPIVYFLYLGQYLLFSILGGATPGHRIVGLKIVRFSDGQMPTPKQALIRTALLAIVITAITFDQNGRGINERFSGTVLIRSRKS
jgi:uncharacterized RDD family membrane protein YckC